MVKLQDLLGSIQSEFDVSEIDTFEATGQLFRIQREVHIMVAALERLENSVVELVPLLIVDLVILVNIHLVE